MRDRREFLRQTGAVLLGAGLISGLSGVAAQDLLIQEDAMAGPNIPGLPELNWEQRSDWLNVKTGMTGIGPTAVGDGVADDTAALQAAFDAVRGKGSRFSTVYLPPGTYRITQTLDPRRPGHTWPDPPDTW